MPCRSAVQSYSSDQRVRARILYVDPSTKKVSLALLPHLQHFSLPTNPPMLGQVGAEHVFGSCMSAKVLCT